MATNSIGPPGSLPGGGNPTYTTVAAWWASLPATLTEDEIGEVYGVLNHSATLPLVGINTNGFQLVLQAAASQGLNAFTANDPLRYNAAMGGALVKNAGFTNFLTIQAGLTLRRLQIAHNYVNNYDHWLISCQGVIDSCLIDTPLGGPNQMVRLEGTAGGAQRRIVNSAILVRDTRVAAAVTMTNVYGVNCAARNCTILRDSDLAAGGAAIDVGYGTEHIALNTLVLGSWSVRFDAVTWAAASDYNASDDTSAPGANSVDNLVAGEQVVSISDPDARLTSGHDLAAGIRDEAFTNDLDIIGQARSLTTPCIGAFEVTTGQTVAIGLVTETDSAAASTSAKAKAIGVLTETDAALSVSFNGSNVYLDVAHGRELRNQSGAVWANIPGWSWTWYDSLNALMSPSGPGTPAGTGTFDTNALGEAVFAVPGTTLPAGQQGVLLIRHPNYPTTPVLAMLVIPIGP